MGDPSHGIPPSERPAEERLDSWKEIAAYLGRDVTTVQRWEKREGMPVHRHVHDKRGSVYALQAELDVWKEGRREHLEAENGQAVEERRAAAEPFAGAPSTAGASAPELQQERTGRSRLLYALALGGSAGVVLLLAYMAITRSRATGAVQPRIRSLAVLPLKNMSGDPGQDYLADGLTEAVIGRLSQIRDLRVVSRTSVMRFKDTKTPVPEIAKTLGVDAIVEGSVIRDGSQIRVYAQLIRGATDTHLWSESYDRQFEDVLALESDVAQSIATRVQVSTTGDEQRRLAASRPVAPEVYESYLKGEFAYEKSNTRAEMEGSAAYFQDAISRDPTFAPAYVGLATVYNDLGTVLVGGPPAELRPKELSAARKAVELDPTLAEAHFLLADELQRQWHWAEARDEYKRALELKPNDAEAHAAFAGWLLVQGRTDEALAWAQRGRELDPLAVSGIGIGWILFQSHRYDEALRELRSVLAARPDNVQGLWFLGFALIADNQPKEAIPPLEKVVSITGRSPGALGVLIRAYAHAGRRQDALRLLAELNRRRKQGYVPAGALVNAYLGVGDNEQAFAWLEQAYKEQSNILQFLKVHPYFDPLRGDLRFANLVHRVGLDQSY